MLQRFLCARLFPVACDSRHRSAVSGKRPAPRSWAVLPLLLLWVACPSAAGGGVIITLEPSDPSNLLSDARVSFSGSGVITAAGTGTAADFLNFDPNVFDGLSDATADFPVNVEITGTDASTSGPYFQQFETLRLTNQSGGDDISWRDRTDTSFAFEVGDSFAVSGMAVLSGLAFSNLLPGDYQASLTSGDAAKFESATLQIRSAAVPEPSSIVSFAGLLAGFAVWCRQRSRN